MKFYKIPLFTVVILFINISAGCTHPWFGSTSRESTKEYPEPFAHGPIEEVFPNIFIVTGSSVFKYEEMNIQKSNNMIIVREGDKLTLINTLRLNEEGLRSLDALGKVTNVIRLGAFHDRNDPFYINRYKAKLWAIKGMKHNDNLQTDFELSEHGPVPFPNSSVFIFKTATQPEGILRIANEGGILITCDSIKNWTKVDSFFSEQTGRISRSKV